MKVERALIKLWLFPPVLNTDCPSAMSSGVLIGTMAVVTGLCLLICLLLAALTLLVWKRTGRNTDPFGEKLISSIWLSFAHIFNCDMTIVSNLLQVNALITTPTIHTPQLLQWLLTQCALQLLWPIFFQERKNLRSVTLMYSNAEDLFLNYSYEQPLAHMTVTNPAYGCNESDSKVPSNQWRDSLLAIMETNLICVLQTSNLLTLCTHIIDQAVHTQNVKCPLPFSVQESEVYCPAMHTSLDFTAQITHPWILPLKSHILGFYCSYRCTMSQILHI